MSGKHEETVRIWIVRRGHRRKVACPAHIAGPFAIHRGVMMDGDRVRFYADRFTVTHVPSGMAINQGLSRREADRLVLAMRRAPLSDAFWSRIRFLKDMKARHRKPLLDVARARRREIVWESVNL
jgi:hypothetical protein